MPDQINPYVSGLRLLANRLRWDLHPSSWASRSRLRRLRGTESGKAIVVCNGPSLNLVDFATLRGVKTIGLNKINLLFDRTDWRPNWIVSVNPHVIKQNYEFFSQTSIPLFIGAQGRAILPLRSNVVFLHEVALAAVATDCSMSVTTGGTVTSVALQLALHLGFTEIGLVGCDHNFASKGPPNQLVQGLERDDNHFHPDYFSKDVQWQLPDLICSEYYYQMLRDTALEHGVRIYNCTVGGKLEVFPRLGLSEFLGNHHS